ncbi:hypothetical protein AVEN_179528-1 [Araneus ventricosus]|uniref:Uncharacterized protein n=1 Tax=Araneus ventricosus TaxID=182803 RepID=A0A4Y2P2L5_ARAVE|nr:hypothetical protein AVEN_179528-1 [Araneus ventricosus]
MFSVEDHAVHSLRALYPLEHFYHSNMDHGGLGVRSGLRGRGVPGSKFDSTEDQPQWNRRGVHFKSDILGQASSRRCSAQKPTHRGYPTAHKALTGKKPPSTKEERQPPNLCHRAPRGSTETFKVCKLV